ncbi:1186_t:CDS:2 [Dentiscutata erythropus]|uniref:1186_t:CDS:1 n=1 Tax=Dentiscutata erythropus TaxID=1348616 RepID=A0A9N9BGS0_9GLOM|nr:1186_t:CDS:2 [Dentiscutata erythropus]
MPQKDGLCLRKRQTVKVVEISCVSEKFQFRKTFTGKTVFGGNQTLDTIATTLRHIKEIVSPRPSYPLVMSVSGSPTSSHIFVIAALLRFSLHNLELLQITSPSPWPHQFPRPAPSSTLQEDQKSVGVVTKNAALWQVKSDTSINKGKWFWTCPVKNFDYQCRFFHWASDSEVDEYFRSQAIEYESEDATLSQQTINGSLPTRITIDITNEDETSDDDDDIVQIVTNSTNNSRKHLRDNDESSVNNYSRDITQKNSRSTSSVTEHPPKRLRTDNDLNVNGEYIESSLVLVQNDEIVLTENDFDPTWLESVAVELREERAAKQSCVSTTVNNDVNNNTAEDNNDISHVDTPLTITNEDVEENDATVNENMLQDHDSNNSQSSSTAHLGLENAPQFTTTQLTDMLQSHVSAQGQLISELRSSVDFVTKQRDQALKDLDEARKQVLMVRKEMRRMRHEIDVARAESNLLRAEKKLLNYDISVLKQNRRV